MKKKQGRGGARENAGANVKGKQIRIKVSFTLEPDCKEYLDSLAETQGVFRSDLINQMIRQMMED